MGNRFECSRFPCVAPYPEKIEMLRGYICPATAVSPLVDAFPAVLRISTDILDEAIERL
jgi:hypothetical protein